ncbi:MAG: hypothetical protein H3C50_00785 [Kiritimatiellae bacterium]|nr:hypothetical protein [Kiritimatiellia bacterium]MCO5068110.1 hypothetical protein [Kiritimatiellia bacterium]
MNGAIAVLIAEALAVYLLVLFAHGLRRRFGLVHFYALMGGITAVMSWITDAGLRVQISDAITFNVGSTVFYTALILGVFVIYVFDGPRPTRVLISTIIGISILVPVVTLILQIQTTLIQGTAISGVAIPSVRINSASVVTTTIDLIFLAVVWEVLGKPALRIHLWSRTYISLLGVMWLDVILFSTLAFAGTPLFKSVVVGSLLSRFFVSIAAFPLLYLYLRLEGRRQDVQVENRPILAILRQIADVKEELTSAHNEIARRKAAEEALQRALQDVKTLRGLIPICAHCKRIRDDRGSWHQLELYIRQRSDAEFSHGICPSCLTDYIGETPAETSDTRME